MSTVVCRYDYKDASGKVLASKIRLEPKSFRWVVSVNGSEVNGLNGLSQSDLPLYHLSDILNAHTAGFIYLAEGEKDADSLRALGLVGTTSPEGAGATSLPAKRFEALRGRHVVLLPDNDKPGHEYMERVAEALRDVAASIRTLYLPDLGEKEDVSDWIARGGTPDALHELAESHGPDIWQVLPSEVRPGRELAEEIFSTIKRYVVLSDEAAHALTLWVLHTHCFEAASFSGYINISSPSRESGKTTLIDVLEALVPVPLRADSASSAAIYRSVDCGRGVGKPTGHPPVLFLDELDAVFGSGGGKSDKAEAIRGVLNSGFRSTGKTLVCDGDANEPRAFVTFCPKVLAAIGACIPDTVTSRSIPIPLSRATREELKKLQPARARTLEKLRETLTADIETWALSVLPSLKRREEPILDLRARLDDIWGPLLAIADELGGDWPVTAREAARVLHADKGDTTDGRDPGVALLADLRELFMSPDGGAYITSARLAELLRGLEGRPWAEYRNGNPITVNGIARLLRPFGIEPRKERVGLNTVRAYFECECQEAFKRYLPQTATAATEGASPSGGACSGSLSRGGLGPATNSESVAVVPAVALAAVGAPLSWDPDPEGRQPMPF